MDLIAQVLLSDTPAVTPAPVEEQDDAKLFENGGVDGTRTRDLRRDRQAKGVGPAINGFPRFVSGFERSGPTRDDRKRRLPTGRNDTRSAQP